MKKLELDVLQAFRDEKRVQRNLKTVVERILLLENNFASSTDAQELKQEFVNQFNSLYEKYSNTMQKQEIADILLKSYIRLNEPSETSQQIVT